ncbi:UNVERIFIED_CONTAM: hypothetical protein Sradi_5855800 [Sesamum radiatum]|uniref:Uncharacterized protein n=1 Tax=Sesamum radiatum TaxID=300843 RepID=A0AAW2KPZ0_SESRA
MGPNLLATTSSIGMGCKAKPLRYTALSVFEGERFVLNYIKVFLQKMWSDLLVKILKTLVDFISFIKDDVLFVLESMKSFQHFDISKVEKLLNAFFAKATAYEETGSSSSDKLSKVLLERQLKEANSRHQDAQVKKSEEISKIQSTIDELERIKNKLMDLKEQRMNLCAALKGQKQFLHNAKTEVYEIEVEIATLENIIPLNDKAVENLEFSRTNLDVL